MPTSRLVRLIIGLGISIGLYSLLPVYFIRRHSNQPMMSPSTTTTSAASSTVPKAPRPASGSSRKHAIFRCATSRASSPTTVADSSCPICRRRTTRCGRAATALWTARRPPAKPGQRLAITATPAPNEAAAAHYYPAIYWYSMLKIPAADQFGGKNSIPPRLTQTAVDQRDEEHRLHRLPSARSAVHAHDSGGLGTFASGAEAWRRRVQSGQSGQQMLGQLTGLGDCRLPTTATGSIASPRASCRLPSRHGPQGVERNIVVTLRDWMNDKQYLHDLIASDRRYPTVNAYGPLFGSPEYSSDVLPILDPVKNVATTFKAPVRDPDMPLSLGPGHAAALDALQPSPYWGTERIWDTRVNNHNSMFGRDGRALAGGVGSRARRTRRSASRVRITHPRRRSRWSARFAIWRCSNRRRRSTRSSIRVSRPTTCNSATTQRHDLDERRRPGRGLAEHEDVRPDRRRREIAGMDGARARHQRQRQTGRVRRAGPAAGSDEGHADQLGLLCGDAESGGRIDLGRDARRARRGCAGLRRARIRRRRRWPRSTVCRCLASARAAQTSTAKASCGSHWAAGTWAASIAASAKHR